MTGDSEIRILNASDACQTIFEEPGKWNVISINPPEITTIDESLEMECASLLRLSFHDSWSDKDRERGDSMPEEHHVRSAIEFAADKNFVLVHCMAGISRSSAIAFIVGCSQGMNPFSAVLELMDPGVHAPNPLIVKLGAQILGNRQIIDAFNIFEKVSINIARLKN